MKRISKAKRERFEKLETVAAAKGTTVPKLLAKKRSKLTKEFDRIKTSPWLVLCKDGRHYFKTELQVVKFVASRKGKIGAIMYDGKLIPNEIKIYHAGLRLAGLLN